MRALLHSVCVCVLTRVCVCVCVCRHVILPPDVAKLVPQDRLMSEREWRGIGVQQSRGWEHYAVHKPEPVR